MSRPLSCRRSGAGGACNGAKWTSIREVALKCFKWGPPLAHGQRRSLYNFGGPLCLKERMCIAVLICFYPTFSFYKLYSKLMGPDPPPA